MQKEKCTKEQQKKISLQWVLCAGVLTASMVGLIQNHEKQEVMAQTSADNQLTIQMDDGMVPLSNGGNLDRFVFVSKGVLSQDNSHNNEKDQYATRYEIFRDTETDREYLIVHGWERFTMVPLLGREENP